MIHPCLSSTKNTPVSCIGVPLALFFPLLPAVYRLENRPARAHRPSEIGIPEIHAHERDLGPGFLGSGFQLWFRRVYGWNDEMLKKQSEEKPSQR